MTKGERLVLVGYAFVECLEGCVEIHGYELVVGQKVSIGPCQPCLCARGQGELLFRRREGKVKLGSRLEEVFDNFAILRVKKPSHALAFGINATRIPAAWREDTESTVMVCGDRGTGKSTLVRFLANRHPGSWVLDADPGQPLNGPPGLLSLWEVSSIDRSRLVSSFFFGDLSPRDAPATYAKCVARLLERCTHITKTKKLFINTCGWTKGLGAQLLRAIVDALPSPHTVLLLLPHQAERDEDTLIHARLLKSPFKTSLPTASPQQKRNLMLATYFSSNTNTTPPSNNGALADPDCQVAESLAKQVPIEANFDQLKIAFVGSAYSSALDLLDDGDKSSSSSSPRDRLILGILNASIVGLASSQDMLEEGEIDFTSCDAAPLVPCRALALVAGIDFFKRTILLHTPAAPSLVSNCDILLKGTLAPPVSLLYRGPRATTPYLSCESISAGLAAPMRSTRKNERRRKGLK